MGELITLPNTFPPQRIWTLRNGQRVSTNYVPDDGLNDAEILLVGEAPGRHENSDHDRLGRLRPRPFVGPSGFLLNDWWHGVGLTRRHFKITNVFPYWPPFEEFKKANISKEEMAKWAELLHQKIARMPNLRMIVPTGKIALKALYGKDAISKYRGSILQYTDRNGRKIKMIPTLHPAGFFRDSTVERRCKADWLRIAEDLDFTDLRLPKRNHITAFGKDNEEFKAEATAWIENAIATAKYIAIDIETIGDKITCVGFATNSKESLTIPLDGGHFWFIPADRDYAWGLIKRILLSNLQKVFQNGLYDVFWFALYGVTVKRWFWDTLAMHHCWDSSDEHSLEYMASVDSREPFWKSESKEAVDKKKKIRDLLMYWQYNGKDCCVTIELFFKYLKRLKEGSLMEFYHNHYSRMFWPLMGMMIHGVNINNKYRKKTWSHLQADMIEIEDKLEDLAGYALHAKKVLSQKKLAQYLFEELKLPVYYLTKKDMPSTSLVAVRTLYLKFQNKIERVRAELVSGIRMTAPGKLRRTKDLATWQMASQALELIMLFRKKYQTSTFFADSRVDVDDRMRCTFSFNTKFGRLSSSKSPNGSGCLLPEAEVLTREGWQSFSVLKPGTLAAEWNPNDGSVLFKPAKIHQQLYDGDMFVADSWFHKNAYTLGHGVPVISHAAVNAKTDHHVKPRRVAAEIVSEYNDFALPISGEFNEGSINYPFIRLLVAVQADATIEGNAIRVAFKRKRKIKRFLMLCDQLGLIYNEQSAHPGYRRFYLPPSEAVQSIINYLTRQKVFGSWLLEFDLETLRSFVDELRYWDGHRRGQSFWYFSVKDINTEWVQTVCHLTGYSTTKRTISNRSKGSYGEFSAQPLHYVAVKPRRYAMTGSKHFKSRHYKGEVFCLITDSGYFLTRYQGVVTVTGNTNLQNQQRDQPTESHLPSVRSMFIPDIGCFFLEPDLSQAESRAVGMFSEDKELIRLARTMPWEFDVHAYNAEIIFKINFEQLLKEDKERAKQLRDLAKRAVHGSNYLMTGFMLAEILLKDAGITMAPDECQAMIDAYIAGMPGVSQYHELTWQQVRLTRQLHNTFGRVFHFENMRLDQEAKKAAMASRPQGEVADIIDQYGVIPLHWHLIKYNKAKHKNVGKLHQQVHDSMLISMLLNDRPGAYEIMKFTRKSLERPRTYDNGEQLTIPATFKIGMTGAGDHEFKKFPNWKEFLSGYDIMMDKHKQRLAA